MVSQDVRKSTKDNGARRQDSKGRGQRGQGAQNQVSFARARGHEGENPSDLSLTWLVVKHAV